MSSTRLTLVRHGAARAADDGVIAGVKGCTGLSDVGRRQAEALRDRLLASPIEVDVVRTSVLPRAIETAAIIAPALGVGPAEQDCDLCELHPGECDGTTWEQWREAYGFNPAEELDREMSPGGESLIGFARRVVAALDALLAEHAGRSIVLVVHGGVIASTMLHLLGVDVHSVHERVPLWFDPANTSLTEWHREDGGSWRMDRYNDAAHLEGLDLTPG